MEVEDLLTVTSIIMVTADVRSRCRGFIAGECQLNLALYGFGKILNANGVEIKKGNYDTIFLIHINCIGM